MKSLTGKFSSARGWALLLILFLGAGLVVAACGDEEVPTPTTPAPPPPAPPPAPEPEPEPEAPAVPAGLRISATGMDFIEWSWTPVNDVSGYDVQYSPNEAFTDQDEVIARTAEEISYRRDGLESGTSAYLRVRSATGTGEERVTSDWSTHVTGMTMAAPPPPVAPATPTGFMVSETTQTSITWTWDAVTGAVGYVVQVSADEMFEDTDTVLFNGVPFTTDTSYTATGLDPETTLYARVAAGAGTPTEPLLGAFTTHVTGMTESAAPQAPPAPANLQVKATGSNFIEWEWDEVEGAAGYHAQFSTDSSFSDPDDFFPAGMSNTSQRVSNLEPDSDGYLQVRAYTGTLADPVYGAWSESDKGTTAEPPPPPPAEPLEAPQNVGTSDRQDNSITVTWDDVDDAEEYEVQQSEAGGSFEAANCGSATGGNIVTVTTCTASGLDVRTAYRFRVRALPDSSDTTKQESAWSDPSVSVETTGVAPPPPVTGGDDELNVQWTSTATNVIRWNWDPVLSREDRDRIDHWVCMVDEGATSDPLAAVCDEVPATPTSAVDTTLDSANTWEDFGKNISASSAVLSAGTVRTLRIVRTWEEELGSGLKVRRYGTPVAVSASTPPMPGTTPATTSPPNSARKTPRITWSFETDSGFDYRVQVLSASRDGTLPTNCDDGMGVSRAFTSSTDNVMQSYSTVPGEYKQYQACVRAESAGSGKSGWAMIGAAQMSLPGQPSAPRIDPETDTPADTHGSQAVNKLVWTVTEKETTPRSATAYRVAVYWTSASSTSVSRDDICGGSAPGFTPIPLTNQPTDGPDGIVITAEDGTTDLLAAQTTAGTYRFYACVQADPTPAAEGNDEGPWNISSAQTISIKAPRAPSGLRVSATATTVSAITWTWNSVQSRSAETISYQVRYGPSCPPTSDTWDAASSIAGAMDTTAASGTLLHEVSGLNAATTRSLRVRATRDRGGPGSWSGCVSGRTLASQ